MAIDYLPVMLSIDKFPVELEQWIASRFEILNGRRVYIVRDKDLPAAARDIHPYCLQPWLWDVVPADTERILHVDTDMVPLRSLPELPDAEFVAAMDGAAHSARLTAIFPALRQEKLTFNAGFFVANRSLRPAFEQMKQFASSRTSNDPWGGDYLQTIFNFLVQATTKIAWLPHDFNSILLTAEPLQMRTAIAVHFCALPRNTRWVVMNALRTAIGLSKLV